MFHWKTDLVGHLISHCLLGVQLDDGPSVIGCNIERFPVIRFFTPSLFFVPDTSELPCQMNYFERKTRKICLPARAHLALCLQSAAKNAWLSLLANKTTLNETRHLTSIGACDRSDISEKGPRTQFGALTRDYTQLCTDTTGDARDGNELQQHDDSSSGQENIVYSSSRENDVGLCRTGRPSVKSPPPPSR